MASLIELKDALKDTLERKGTLRKLHARIRSEVCQALSETEELPKPEPSNENLLINELIREYLIFNGYRDTLSVFLPESGQPAVRPFDRSFMAHQLHTVDGSNSSKVPLLYSLLASNASSKQPSNNTAADNGKLQP
eukprot:jgi/Chrzof1/9952/Cz04g21260.t1